MKKIITFLLSTCMLLCVVVGLVACGDEEKEPISINEYYCYIDGAETKVSLGDVITLPTTVKRLDFDEKLLGWENSCTGQQYEAGEQITLDESMFYQAGEIENYEATYYRYVASFHPIIETIEITAYFHYFDNMTLERSVNSLQLEEFTARNSVTPYCRNADSSIQWKTGNKLDYGWLFLDKYNFEGWYLDEEYTKEFWDSSDIDTSNLGEELHLYAKWTYTGIVYEEYDAARWRVAEIDLSNDIEQIVIPSTYGRGKDCDDDYAGYEIIEISEDAFKGTGTIGTLVLQSGIELSWNNFENANINCISLDNVSIPTYYANSYTKVFDGYTGVLTCSESSDYEFIDGILYDKNTNEILWVSDHIPSEVTLREGVTDIYTLFAGKNIERITLPTNVMYIRDDAFRNCVNLKTVVGKGITRVDKNAFYGCVLIEYETYGGGKYIGNCLIAVEDDASLLEIKDGCKYVPDSVMSGNTTVKKVILPSSVSSIGNNAFENSAIEQIILTASVSSIGDGAFENSAIEEIEILGENLYFGNYAFANCYNLQTVTMPKTTQFIGVGCFENCVLLQSIDLSGLTNVDPTTVTLSWNAFKGCIALKTVIMSESITKLYSGTFSGCSSLQEIILPMSITEIEGNCFNGCSSLKTITMPGVTTLGANCFNGCSALETIELSQAITALPENCFTNCASLTSVSIPAVTTLGANCFMNCTSLTSVSIPGVANLGTSCFDGCTKLNSIVLSVNLGGIDENCFRNCSGLEYVFYLGNSKQWDYVDNNCSNIASKVYFYSAEVQTVENYIETREACWGYDENNVPTAWVVPTNCLEGKTFAMSHVSVTVSDYYWNSVVLAKENGQLESAFGADIALYNAVNTANTKQELEENLGLYYYNKFASQISFEDGAMTTSQNGTKISSYWYLEIDGELIYFPQTKRIMNIVSDTQISDTEEGEKISGNETMTVIWYYSLV